jgi:hypothetical protein
MYPVRRDVGVVTKTPTQEEVIKRLQQIKATHQLLKRLSFRVTHTGDSTFSGIFSPMLKPVYALDGELAHALSAWLSDIHAQLYTFEKAYADELSFIEKARNL